MNNILKAKIANYAGICQTMPSFKKSKVDPPSYTPSPAEIAVLTEAENAWNEYSHSSDGINQLNTIRAVKDIRHLRDLVHGIFDSPEFETLQNLLDELDLPDGSFSMAIYFELEFVLGVGVSLGLALGLGASKDVAVSEFLSVGIVEGIAEEAILGAQFGIWTSPPKDLGGFSLSTELELGLGADIATAIAYTLKGEFLGVTVAIECGEGVGLIEGESYTYVLGSEHEDQNIIDQLFNRPAYQSPKKNLLIIERITCKHPSKDGIGDENEIYFTFKADDDDITYHYPTYNYYSMKKGDKWSCGRSIWFDEKVTVQLYENDSISSDDLIGEYEIHLSQLKELDTYYKYNSKHDYSSDSDKIEYTLLVNLLAKEVEAVAL